MKLLVTGGAGFIGSNFVHYWVKRHPEDMIVVLDKLTYAGNLENLEPVKDRVSFIHGDICDEAVVDRAFREVDTVVHFAAASHVDRSIKDPSVFVRTNVIGTEVLLRHALHAEVKRFHHVSTDEVFGHLSLESNELWTENSPYNPRNPYSASKAGSDHLVRAYFHTNQLPVTLSNCSNNFGPYSYPEKLLPLAITNLLEGKKVPIYTPGNQVREWLYVEDHCSGIERILEAGKIGETYFIGPQENQITNLELIRKLVGIMRFGEDMIEFVKDRPGHDQKYALDSSKIRRDLGWQSQYTLEEGLKKTIDWYCQHGHWWKKIKSGEYQNYYHEQYELQALEAVESAAEELQYRGLVR